MQAVRRAVGNPRNWLLLTSAIISVVATYSLLQAHGAGTRWARWLALVLLASIACDARIRAAIMQAWSEVMAFARDGVSLPWRATLLLIVLPHLLLLLAHGPGIQTGDSRPVVMTAASLVTDGNCEVSEFAELYRRHHLFTVEGEALPYFLIERPSGIYSHYPPGMVPLAMPVVAAARLVNSRLDEPLVQQYLEQLVASLVAAACAVLFFLLALHLATPATALIMTVILASGSVLYSTVGQALWQQGGVIFWTELLLLVEFRTWRQPSWQATTTQAAAMAMMVSCRLSAGLIVATFGLWVAYRSPRRAIKLGATAALAMLPLLAFNESIYGCLTGPMVVQTNGLLWSFGTMNSWAGVLFSPTHGLLVYQPWLVLAPFALWMRAANSDREGCSAPPGWQIWILSAVALHLSMVSSWWCWWGGHCWGSRLAAETVPLAALLCLQPLTGLLKSRWGRSLLAAVAVTSISLHVPSIWLGQDRWYDGMSAEAQMANAWQWRSPPFLYPYADLSYRSFNRPPSAPAEPER